MELIIERPEGWQLRDEIRKSLLEMLETALKSSPPPSRFILHVQKQVDILNQIEAVGTKIKMELTADEYANLQI